MSCAISFANRERRDTGVCPKDTYDWQAGRHTQTVLSRPTLRFDRDTVNFACKSYAWWEKDFPKGANAHVLEYNAHVCDAARFGCPIDRPRLVILCSYATGSLGGQDLHRDDSKWVDSWNVIWVEWHMVDGVDVAEREGLGVVGTDQWETLERTMADIVLG